MKRFVIILLALLSGLSVPQAVAAAAGQADAQVIAAPLAARAAQPGSEAHVPLAGPAPAFTAGHPAVRPIQGFAPAVRTIHFGDRARE